MAAEHDRRAAQGSASEPHPAALERALDDLEEALGERTGAGKPHQPAGSGQGGEAGEPHEAIPLLDQVVAPGAGPDLAAPAEEALYRRLAERLASELDVIVQGRLERLVEQARTEIRRQVRDHLAITLRELIDEIENE